MSINLIKSNQREKPMKGMSGGGELKEKSWYL